VWLTLRRGLQVNERHDMKKLIDEFKAFINQGDVVTIAVGLVLALAFKDIIDKIIAGIITPIIAAVFGKSDYSRIGFDLGDSFISIGLVIGAIIDFICIALVLFLIVKAYDAYRARKKAAGEEVEEPTEELLVLREIRDALLSRP
jgi:large conductance mechanosensitive channel